MAGPYVAFRIPAIAAFASPAAERQDE